MYPLAYERCLRNVIASEGRRTTAMSRGWATLAARLLRPVLRAAAAARARGVHARHARPQPHASIHHRPLRRPRVPVVAAARRSHRCTLPTTGYQRYGWFAVPLGYVFWMVCGVRVSLMMPVEPVANWIFKLTEPVDKRRVLTTVVTVMSRSRAADRDRVCRRGARPR